MYHARDVVHEPLYIITPVFNPVRYKSRWKLYDRFKTHVLQAGGVLYTIECAFGGRDHALKDHAPHGHVPESRGAKADQKHHAPDRGQHKYIPVRTRDELWLKENLINVAMRHLPADWQYVAWVDADVQFARPNWVGETIQQLQHYDLVQMFSHYQDVGPNYELIGQPSPGFGAFYGVHEHPPHGHYHHHKPHQTRGRGAPGLAWAARRSAIERLGGLLDINIVGAGDWYMAHALIGKIDLCLFHGITAGYRRHLDEWQRRAEQYIRRNVGSVSGLAIHQWHGKKAQRGYQTRMAILRDNQFDPDLDLARDHQGLLQLVDRGDARSLRLRDQLRAYARARNEDAIDL